MPAVMARAFLTFVVAATVLSSCSQIALASDLLITCPIAATTQVQSLSVKSLQPVNTQEVHKTTFVAWKFASVDISSGIIACDQKTDVQIATGVPLSIPGTQQALLTRQGSALNISVEGESGSLPLPEGANVYACQAAQLYVINVEMNSAVVSQLAFNAASGCMGAYGSQLDNMLGSDVADTTPDAAAASQAGIPLPADYTSAPAAGNPLSTASCTNQDGGYSSGLAASFYANAYSAAASPKDSFPLNFAGSPTFQRCDCPNQKTSNLSWPGLPALPTDQYVNNYGIILTGQLLVSRPEGGVVGETPELFPTASDYHLVCLQHDDSAELTIDSTTYYSSETATWQVAGFKQYCVPVALSPGWHDVTLKYGNSPLDAYSVLRLFLLDAAEVATVTVNGDSAYELQWQGQGKCCTGAIQSTCVPPLDCCRLRSTGCGSGSPIGPSRTLAMAPAAQAAAAPAPAPSATDAAAFGIDTPASAPLPANAVLVQCQAFDKVCAALDTMGSAPTTRNVSLICNATQGLQSSYETEIVYNSGVPGWLSVSPARGDLVTNMSEFFSLQFTPGVAGTGYHNAIMVVYQTFSFLPDFRSIMGSVDVTYLEFGDRTAEITSVTPSTDGFATVSAVASIAFNDTSGTVQLPLSGSFSIYGSDTPVNVTASGPTSTDANGLTTYALQAELPLADAFECGQAPIQFTANITARVPRDNPRDYRDCGSVALNATLEFCQQPQCQMFSVDMAFCGSEGLVTDGGSAMFILACSEAVQLCSDCFTIAGPTNATVQYFSNVRNSNTSYHLLVKWDEAYQGPVTLDLEAKRGTRGCDLLLSEPGCGNWTDIAPVQPLSFLVKDAVQVKAVAYKIFHDCQGAQCSYSL